MDVSVHQGWQDHPGFPRFLGFGSGRSAERDDAAVVHGDPSVADGRGRDWQDPRGAVDDQCPGSRAFFSAALRAA